MRPNAWRCNVLLQLCSCLSAFAWFQFHCLWCLHFDWIFALWLTQFLIRLTSSPPSLSFGLLLAPLTWPMRHQMQPHQLGSKARESKSWSGVKPPYMTDFCQAPYLFSPLSLLALSNEAHSAHRSCRLFPNRERNSCVIEARGVSIVNWVKRHFNI